MNELDVRCVSISKFHLFFIQPHFHYNLRATILRRPQKPKLNTDLRIMLYMMFVYECVTHNCQYLIECYIWYSLVDEENTEIVTYKTLEILYAYDKMTVLSIWDVTS